VSVCNMHIVIDIMPVAYVAAAVSVHVSSCVRVVQQDTLTIAAMVQCLVSPTQEWLTAQTLFATPVRLSPPSQPSPNGVPPADNITASVAAGADIRPDLLISASLDVWCATFVSFPLRRANSHACALRNTAGDLLRAPAVLLSPGGSGPTCSPLDGGGGQWRLSPSHSIWALLESPAGGSSSREALRSPTAFQCAQQLSVSAFTLKF
jgi:hypothetical protein